MIFPWGTDAPIYHWPITTVVLIGVNVLAFVGQATGVVDTEQFSLVLGDGLHPVQWLTHNFLHVGPVHLVGNMIFLWAFGLVAEGKLGWWRMLVVCLAIGILHGAGVQALMLGLDEPRHALGASAVVFGLVALCMVWAPANEITLHGWGWMGYWSWDAPIYVLAMLYVGQELVWLVVGKMTGLAFGSAIGHLSGALWGFVLGSLMVKLQWVDCENWDMYSLIRKRASLGAQWKKRGRDLDRKKRASAPTARHADEVAAVAAGPGPTLAENIDALMTDGDFERAAAAIDRGARVNAAWPLRSELLGWITQMQKEGAAATSVPLMRLYCARFPEQADRVRLRLAQTYLNMNKSSSAARALADVAAATLPPELQRVYTQLQHKTQRMRDEGAYEIEEAE